MRNIKKEELRDLLYMYEQTFISQGWAYEVPLPWGLPRGLCYMNDYMYESGVYTKKTHTLIEGFLDKFSNEPYLTPNDREIAFYKIVNFLLNDQPLDNEVKPSEVEQARRLLYR